MITRQGELQLSSEQITDRLNCELLSTTWHANRLEGRVTLPFGADIVIAFYVDVTDMYATSKDDHASIPLSIGLAESLHLTPQDVFRFAQKNIKGSCIPMSCIMQELCPDNSDIEAPGPFGLFVITNSEKVKGASCILNPSVQNEITSACHGPAYIIPSSTHELLALPVDIADPEFIASMVYDINRNEVQPEDRLSDHVFVLNDHEITVAV